MKLPHEENPEPIQRRRKAPLQVLYQDEQLYAVIKPAGLSTASDRWDSEAPTVTSELWKLLQQHDPGAARPHLVHRLDKDTSGVMIFARQRPAQEDLRRQFQERKVEKTYLALVKGCLHEKRGSIEIQVSEDPRRAGKMQVVSQGGRACRTAYQVLEEFRGVSWVRLFPLTGRTHQIRVSLCSIGHPLAVDALYGDAAPIRISNLKRNYRTGRGRTEQPLMARLTLHAESLTLRHPGHGERLTLEAPLPADLRATLKQLRKWAAL